MGVYNRKRISSVAEMPPRPMAQPVPAEERGEPGNWKIEHAPCLSCRQCQCLRTTYYKNAPPRSKWKSWPVEVECTACYCIPRDAAGHLDIDVPHYCVYSYPMEGMHNVN